MTEAIFFTLSRGQNSHIKKSLEHLNLWKYIRYLILYPSLGNVITYVTIFFYQALLIEAYWPWSHEFAIYKFDAQQSGSKVLSTKPP